MYRIQHPYLVQNDTMGELLEIALLQRPQKAEPVRILAVGGKEETTSPFMEIGETDANDSSRFTISNYQV
jgi:hypothetical protein